MDNVNVDIPIDSGTDEDKGNKGHIRKKKKIEGGTKIEDAVQGTQKNSNGDRVGKAKQSTDLGNEKETDTFLEHTSDRHVKAAEAAGTGHDAHALKSVKISCCSHGNVPNQSGQVKVLCTGKQIGFAGKGQSQISCAWMELNKYSIKERLLRHWCSMYDNDSFCSEKQAALFTALYQYKDILHLNREATEEVVDEHMDAVLLHCINHIMKTADLVKKGNQEAKVEVGKQSQEDTEPQKDQGFTRPKVLVLLPVRKFTYRYIKRMMKLIIKPNFSSKDFKSVPGGNQFIDEYSSSDLEEELKASGNGDVRRPMASKPKDFRAIFEGNSDDHFRLGVKLTKSAVKLYSDFYKSDMIFASPLGLVTIINDSERSDGKSFEFLSSIEVLVVDFADVLMMQNWEHVLTVMEHINKVPSSSHDTNIMRIREWYLSGKAANYRQTIVLSSYPTPELNSFIASCSNYEGLVKFPLSIKKNGVLEKILPAVKQLYIRYSSPSIVEDSASRFAAFDEEILKRLSSTFTPGILIFVRSYFDFVKLRNKLDEENASFVAISEYTERSSADRGRSLFAKGSIRMLLYSERAHFYFRYRIKGIRDVVFYSLPDHPHYYSEILNMIDTSYAQQPTASTMYSKYDSMQLNRIIGSKQAKQMLNSQTNTAIIT